MHGRKYEHATVLEDLQGGVKLDVTGGPVGIEYDLEKMDVVHNEVLIQGHQVISLEVRLVYRSFGDTCIQSVEWMETFVKAVKVP